MELGFGGPVWHASAALLRRDIVQPVRSVYDVVALAKHAALALRGVGDAKLGEWGDRGATAVHVRRRLTEAEWGGKPWGMDLRHTPEARRRLAHVRHILPVNHHEL